MQKGVSITGLIRITRFWNLLIIVLAQYFTAYFLLSPATLIDINLFFLSLSTVMIAAAGYIINDYYDVKIDLINKPNEVVIGKTLARRYALFFIALFLLLVWSLDFFFRGKLVWLIICRHFCFGGILII